MRFVVSVRARAVSWCLLVASVFVIPLRLNAADEFRSSTAAGKADQALGASDPARSYGDLPLRFEANRGQADSRVLFLSRGSGYTFFLTPNESVLAFSSAQNANHSGPQPAIFHMRFEGSSAASVSGVDRLPGASNYFIGQDPSRWLTAVPNYQKINYQNIYPGIDLVYYGNQHQLEYDFIVSPGADARLIRLSLEGARQVTLDSEGNLVLRSGDNAALLKAPVAYQEINGQKRKVAGEWRLTKGNTAEFHLAAYDRGKPLVIDPVLKYSSFLGGSQSNSLTKIAVDASGNTYVAGYTASGDFPAAPTPGSATFGGGANSRGAFVAKIDPTGSSLLYTTYLSGSGDQLATGLAVDSSGNVYVAGTTSSTDFPVLGALQPACAISASTGACSDAFLTKIAPAGNGLVYSTYLGGTGDDSAAGLAVDVTGNAYVVGNTSSKDFPVTSGALQTNCAGACTQNAFVAKFSPQGESLSYSTYLGGSGSDSATGIALDAVGNVYLTGYTSSADFPLAGAFQKSCAPDQASTTTACMATAFVTKVKADGSGLAYSTYLGGSLGSKSAGIAVDSFGSAYITGSTQSADFPISKNALQKSCGMNHAQCAVNAFVTKLTPSGDAAVYSTYLGGSNHDEAGGIAVDMAGNAHVVGQTASTDFPTVAPLQSKLKGASDAFVAVLNATGQALKFSTFHGGTSTETGTALALDGKGDVYVAGETSSTDFPTLKPFQSSCAGTCSNAFVSKMSTNAPAGTPATILIQAGSGQSAVVSTAFATAFTVQVVDSSNTGVDGVTVTFAPVAGGTGASGTFSSSAVITTAGGGLATAPTFTANATTGPYTVTASIATAGVTPVTFNVSNTATAPSSISVKSGNGQSALISTAFAAPFVTTVLDSKNNAVQYAIVTYGAPASGASGTFSDSTTATTTATTGTGGSATPATFTANASAGAYTIVASVSGVATNATFSASNTASAPNSIAVSGGSNQTTVVSTAFASPLSAMVLDSSSKPVSGALVTFTAPASGASGTFPGGGTSTIVATDTSGIAAVTFTANATAGGPYAVTASVTGVSTPVSFSLSNISAAPNAIAVTSGNNQTVAEGQAYASALVAKVTDKKGNGVQFAVVTFTVTPNSNGATAIFSDTSSGTTTVSTDANGVATTTATLTANSTAGSFTVAAAVSDLSTPATFNLTNIAGPPASITITGGSQSTQAGIAFATSLVATVKDSGSNGVPNVGVVFVAPTSGASGTFTNGTGTGTATTTVQTDTTGTAATTLVANCTLGAFSVTASIPTPLSATASSLTITTGPAKTVNAVAGTTPQSVQVGSPFGTTLAAQVVDCGKNPVQGVTVTFTAGAAGNGASGTFANGTNTTNSQNPTDATGTATATTFTANNTSGTYAVTAATGTATSATYTLTNAAGPPSSVTPVTGSTPQNITVGTNSSALTVVVKDAKNNPVPGATVTYTVNASGTAGGSFNGSSLATGTTIADGTASPTVPFTANTIASITAYSVTASVAGASGPIQTSFSLTNVPAAPATITPTAGTAAQVVPVNNSFVPLSGVVKDTYGNTVLAGIGVTLTAPSSGPSATFGGTGTPLTDSTGTFKATVTLANGASGSYNVGAASTTGNATTTYLLTNTDFSFTPGASLYLLGTNPIITVAPQPAPPATSYTGTVTPMFGPLPAGLTFSNPPIFIPATAAFTNGSPSSVPIAAMLSVSPNTAVGEYPLTIIGLDGSASPLSHTSGFTLAVQCGYSLGNTTYAGTTPTYNPLSLSSPYTFYVTEMAGGANCSWTLGTVSSGVSASQTKGTITGGAGTGNPVNFGLSPTLATAQIPVTYFQETASKTGTSTLAVTQETPVSVTGGVGTTDIPLTATGITTANPGTLNIPNATGLAAGVATVCSAANNVGPDPAGNNYFITCAAQISGNAAQLAVTIGSATPADRAGSVTAELMFSVGSLGLPAIVFVGTSLFGRKRKRSAWQRIMAIFAMYLVCVLLIILPACGANGFKATFGSNQATTYNLTVMGYITDANNNVTGIEIFPVQLQFVK